MSTAGKPKAVLLLAHGGPDSLEDVEPFLSNIRGGRPFSAALLEEIRERYRAIGGGSPLLDISRHQAQALERELNAAPQPSDGTQLGRPGAAAAAPERFRVYLGMRNWHPFIRDTLCEIQRDGASRLLAMCLAPQNSVKSIGLYFRHVREAQEKMEWQPPTLFVESWHREPLLIAAFAEKLQESLSELTAAGNAHPVVLFTAHSLPEKVLSQGDPYDREVHETAAAVAERCGLTNWRFAYQSQGATEEPWLGPTVESVLDDLARQGARDVLLSPIGFLADHVEVLYDIDILFRRHAAERQMVLRRTASLNDSPTLIQAIAAIVRRQFAQDREGV